MNTFSLFGLLLIVALALLCGVFAGMVFARKRLHTQLEQQANQHGQAMADLQEKHNGLATDLATWQERANRIPALEDALTVAQKNCADLQVQKNTLEQDLAIQHKQAQMQAQQNEEKLALLRAAREDLSNQFKSLANDILEEKSKRFLVQNQDNLGQLLGPLRERIGEFKVKVEEIHRLDTEQQATLKAELAQIKTLNQQMTAEAHGLAVALKGQAKKQGNWGELVLGNVLERSGLRDGTDFRREASFQTEDGRKRPDVVVYLPENRHLVIDAKVSLNAYTRFVNAEDELERRQALQEHVRAISDRIKELSDRSYYAIPKLNTPEVVFMFIPVESAFIEALKADETLFQKAIGQNVLVTTPTTLLTSLNIVRQLWRFEAQNAHSAELAGQASKVYSKLRVFVESMEKLRKQLDTVQKTFDESMGQLWSGRGNLISQAAKFEDLGVSVKERLPSELVEKAVLEIPSLQHEARSEAPSTSKG